MIITYYGVSCFKIETKGLIFVFDPPSKESKHPSPRFKANAVLISHNHSDHNGADSIAGEPFLIQGPGEYEIKEVFIKGIPAFHDAQKGKSRGLNTVYLMKAEDIVLCHLGDFGENNLRPETKEILGKIDILFSSLNLNITTSEKASDLAKELGPKIIIPMHYELDKSKILKDFSAKFAFVKNEEKLTVKKKDFEEIKKETVYVLESKI